MYKVAYLTLAEQETNTLNKRLKVIIFLLAVVSGLLLVGRFRPVFAVTCTDFSCGPTCSSATGANCCDNPKIDLTCQRNRLVDPSTDCHLLYCADDAPAGGVGCLTKDKLNVNFFGVDFHYDTDKGVASLIYVLFTVFLGFVAVAVSLLGVYGAFLRSRASSPDDEAKAAKLLTNAVIGLILIVVAVVIAQLVACALGVESLDQLISFGGAFTQC